MTKNIIIGILAAIVIVLAGYIIFINIPEKTKAPVGASEEVSEKVPTEELSHFVYQKGNYRDNTLELVFTDNKGASKTTIAKGSRYQYMASKKGSLLYLMKNQAIGGYEVDFVSVDASGKATTLTPFSAPFDSENVQAARYSPDGTKIYFTTFVQGTYIDTAAESGRYSTQEIYSVNSDGTNFQKLTSNLTKDVKINELYMLAGVSKDHNLYFVRGDQVQAGTQTSGLWMFNTTTKVLSKIDNSNEIFGGATISPDGTKLAYIPYDKTSGVGFWTASKPYSIKIMDLVTGNKETLVSDIKNEFNAYFIWSPNSKELVATKDSKSIIIDVEQKITRDFGFNGQVVGWASNTQIVFTRNIENTPTTNVDNVHELRITDHVNQSNSTLIDTSVFAGVGFFGAL